MKDIEKQFDRSVQAAKRWYWRLQQENIQELVSNDPRAFWQQVNQLGVGSERRPEIPWEALRPDVTVLTDKYAVLETWKCEFASLFRSNSHRDPWMTATVTAYAHNNQDSVMNQQITEHEIIRVLQAAKKGKAYGYDGVTVDGLKNGNTPNILYRPFNYCFLNGVPEFCKYGIINPIPKAGGKDNRIPLHYRGITLTSSVYKLFCSVLHNRIAEWAEVNDIIADEQNGFRKKQSCLDHIATLTTIIDTRKKLKKATFCSFIDFSKAF